MKLHPTVKSAFNNAIWFIAGAVCMCLGQIVCYTYSIFSKL